MRAFTPAFPFLWMSRPTSIFFISRILAPRSKRCLAFSFFVNSQRYEHIFEQNRMWSLCRCQAGQLNRGKRIPLAVDVLAGRNEVWRGAADMCIGSRQDAHVPLTLAHTCQESCFQLNHAH